MTRTCKLRRLQRIWKKPLPRDYFADRDWYVEGKNIWIMQVGSKAEFGSYEAFKERVSGAKVTIDDSGDMECTYHMPLPGGGSEALSVDYEDGGSFRLNGQPFQTDLYPRFENPLRARRARRVGPAGVRHRVARQDAAARLQRFHNAHRGERS